MRLFVLLLIVLLVFGNSSVHAATFEEAMTAYNTGDFQKAFAIWRTLADEGDQIAQFNIAMMYGNGQGVERSAELAFQWFKRSAHNGYAPARLQTGIAYHHGYGTKRVENKALRWLRAVDEEEEKKRAEAVIKEIVTGLFPEPSAGWKASDVEVHEKVLVDLLIGMISTIWLAREYVHSAEDETIGIGIFLNDSSMEAMISLVYDELTPKDTKEEQELARSRQKMKEAGVQRISVHGHRGYRNSEAAVVEVTKNTFLVVTSSKGETEARKAYLERADLARIGSVLQGLGTRTMGDLTDK